MTAPSLADPQPGLKPLLVVRDLVKEFPVQAGLFARRRDSVHAVSGISLTIRPGEALGIVGETGSGKSTLARLILRLTEADGGSVVFDGVDVLSAGHTSMKALRRQIQIIFQDPFSALDPRLTIGASLAAPLSQHHLGRRSQRKGAITEQLASVGLDASFVDRYPSECSGGQLQRVVIARALSLHPRLLICDEPTASLDASVRAQILNLLDDLRKQLNLALVIISHDLRVVRYMCDRIAVMYLGRIVEIADRAQAFDRPLHPYTRKLMQAALIDGNSLKQGVGLLTGEPPSPIHPPPGCRFSTRCPIVQERCRDEDPRLSQVEAGHSVACFFWHLQDHPATAT
jgi:peptide/nickel transport system ATP-binding protein